MTIEHEGDEKVAGSNQEKSISKIKKKLFPLLAKINESCLGNQGEVVFYEPKEPGNSGSLGNIVFTLIWEKNEKKQTQRKIEVKVVKGTFIAIFFGDDSMPDITAHRQAFYCGKNNELDLNHPNWYEAVQKAVTMILLSNSLKYDTTSVFSLE